MNFESTYDTLIIGVNGGFNDNLMNSYLETKFHVEEKPSG